MERLPPHLRIEICKYLDATDIVSVCEALPSMKSVLTSLTIKGILRSSVRQMEWVDARLCYMLHSKLLFTESETDSTAAAELEGNMLCRAIRYYEEGCRSPPRYLSQYAPDWNRNILFLMLGRSVMDLNLYSPLVLTLQAQSRQKCLGGADCVGSVSGMPEYDVQINMDDLEGDSAQYVRSFRYSTLRSFDCVVYMIDSALNCHAGCGLPFGLSRLIFRITNLAAMRLTRFPMLLIFDAESRQTESSTSRGVSFERLIAGLHRLDRITLRGYGRPASSSSPCNWWRACRLHQQDGMFVNLHEAFQIAALQVANIDAERSV